MGLGLGFNGARAHQRRVEVAVAGRAPLVLRVGRPRRWGEVRLGHLGRLVRGRVRARGRAWARVWARVWVWAWVWVWVGVGVRARGRARGRARVGLGFAPCSAGTRGPHPPSPGPCRS